MIKLFHSRPSQTLLLITASQVLRVDYAGRRRIRNIGQYVGLRPTGTSFPEAVKLATSLSSQPIGAMSIVSTDLWTSVIELSADIAATASTAELRQALLLEAEIESGISAFDSQIAYTKLGNDKRGQVQYCVTQVPEDLLQESIKAWPARTASRIRLTHPIAIELGDRTTTAQELTASLASWQRVPSEQQLASADAGAFDSCQSFLRKWLQLLQGPEWAKLHAVRPACQNQKISAGLISVSLTVATLAGCMTVNAFQRQSLYRVQESIAQLETLQKQHEENDSAIKQSTTKLVKARSELTDSQRRTADLESAVRHDQQQHAQQNVRWSGLLDALAVNHEECWIQRIESTSVSATIFGIAPSNLAAHQLAVRLDRCLNEAGWDLDPIVLERLGDDLFQFQLTLHPAPAPLPKEPIVQSWQFWPPQAANRLITANIERWSLVL